MAREALALRPVPDADGRVPDPRTRAGMPDLYAHARLLAEEKRRAPGDDVMSILLAQVDEGGRVSDAEFQNTFWLFAVAGNETLRNGLPGGLIALLEHPEQLAVLRTDPSLPPPPPTATSPCSPIPIASTSAAPPTRTCPPGTGRTSASGGSWPGHRCAPCSASCCVAPSASSPTGRRRCCGRPSSAGSSGCRSTGPPAERSRSGARSCRTPRPC
jgi:hypothetical protein